MKKIVSILFIIISLSLYSQDTTTVDTLKSKCFFIGINISPNYCNGFLSNGALSASNFKSEAQLGFTGGFTCYHILHKHIALEAGIQYSKINFSSQIVGLTFGDMIDRRRGFVYNNSFDGNMNFNYQYLEVPLKANFVFGKKKVQFTGSLGITTAYLFQASSGFGAQNIFGSVSINDNLTNTNYTKINLFPSLSLGVLYKINRLMFIRFEPLFRYGMLKITDTPVSQYVWNTGLNVSYFFGL